MPTIYAKTARGQAEFETRVYRLHPRLRTVLILINGQRTDLELVQMLHHAAEGIVMLLEGGFIEPVAYTHNYLEAHAQSWVDDPYCEPLNLDETLPNAIAAPIGAGPHQPLAWPSDGLPYRPHESPLNGEAAAAQAPRFSFWARRRELLRAFNEQAGQAGQDLAERMERSLTPDEIRALLPAAVLLVDEVRGRPAAEAFAVRAEAF
jgi:hypothetical protein